MEESSELYYDKSWYQIDASCKTFPQDLRNGKTEYERSKSSGPTTAALDDDIKTAAPEVLLSAELEQHLVMNRARLITYEQVRSEIHAYIEARRSQFALKTVASKITSDPMEADCFGKGSKKGKQGKKGMGDAMNVKKEGQHQNLSPNLNKDTVCWHCSKKSNLST